MSLKIIYENLEHAGFDAGGSEILHYKGKPFTGFETEYFEDGSIFCEFEYQNGYLEGWQIEYYKNGQVKDEYLLHNNDVVPGTHKKYDESGKLQ